MKKGIIMEIDELFLTLLTPEGEFLRAKKMAHSYNLGEEIYFYPVHQTITVKPLKLAHKLLKTRAGWVLSAALLIFLGSFIPQYQNNKAYAYMSIDVNPSIELGVNKKMQVVELTGYNTDGKKVISLLDDWKKKDVSELTETILSEIKKEGYFKENEKIIISTVRTEKENGTVEKKLEENLQEIKAAVKADNLELTLLKGTKKDLKKAHGLGITTGRYQISNSKEVIETKIQKPLPQGQSKSDSSKVTPGESSGSLSPRTLKKQTKSVPVKKGNQSNVEFRQNDKEEKRVKAIPRGKLKKREEEQLQQNDGQTKKKSAWPNKEKHKIKKSSSDKAKQGIKKSSTAILKELQQTQKGKEK